MNGRPSRRRRWVRRVLMVSGAALIVAGIAVIAVPRVAMWQRTGNDDRAMTEWRNGGDAALVEPAPSTSEPPRPACAPGAQAEDYALVTFPTLARYGYADVAGHGTWDLLDQRSMVHYETSAAPGDRGNAIVAFHREPRYEHIDELGVGDEVDVQDRSCTVYRYQVTQRWDLRPERVTQLVPTSGRDLTLITCTPWWKDDRRLVWRACLIPGDGRATRGLSLTRPPGAWHDGRRVLLG